MARATAGAGRSRTSFSRIAGCWVAQAFQACKTSRTSGAKAHCLASSFAALEALRHWSRWSSLERLAALVPRPRLHLIRFHGVLAPNAKLRRQIVPAPAERAA